MTGEEIRALPISCLDLSRPNREDMVRFVHSHNNPLWKPVHRGSDRIMELNLVASRYTVGDLILACEARREHPYNFGSYLHSASEIGRVNVHTIVRKIGELGMTYLDWKWLDYSTVTLAMLKEMKKEVFLQQTVMLIPTITRRASKALAMFLGKETLSEATISELLAIEDFSWCTHELARKNLKEARRTLLKISMSDEDGPFVKEDARRRVVESLMMEEGFDSVLAERVLKVAEKRGWVSFPDFK